MERLASYIIIILLLYVIISNKALLPGRFTEFEILISFIIVLLLYHIISHIFKKKEKFDITIPAPNNIIAPVQTPVTVPSIAPSPTQSVSRQIPIETTRNDMKYNEYKPIDITKLGMFDDTERIPKNYVDLPSSEGWSILPARNWYPTPPHPPMCIENKVCETAPVFTSGVPVNALDWKDATIDIPTNINIDYIRERLNKA